MGRKLAAARRYALITPSIAVIFGALVLKGANDAQLAPLFSGALLVLLGATIALTPRETLRRAARRHRVVAVAAACFVALAAFSILPASGGLADPLWRAFGLGPGLAAIAPHRVIDGLAGFFLPVAAFALGALSIRERADRDRVGRVILLTAVPFALLALVQHGQDLAVTHGRLMMRFTSANAAALTFAIISFCALALIVRRAKHSPANSALLAPLLRAPIALIALALAVTCLFLTASRAGLSAAAAGLAVQLALLLSGAGGRGGRLRVWLVPVAGVIACLGFFGVGFALDRLVGLEADAGARAVMRLTHWRAFLDRPVWGHGLNSFHELNAHYAAPADWRVLSAIGSAHNIYVQALEEVGVVGAALLGLMIAPALARAAAACFSRRAGGAEWSIALLAAALTALAHGTVDFGLNVPAIAGLFAFFLGAFGQGRTSAEASAMQTAEIAPARVLARVHPC